jgi:hypothetical protein
MERAVMAAEKPPRSSELEPSRSRWPKRPIWTLQISLTKISAIVGDMLGRNMFLYVNPIFMDDEDLQVLVRYGSGLCLQPRGHGPQISALERHVTCAQLIAMSEDYRSPMIVASQPKAQQRVNEASLLRLEHADAGPSEAMLQRCELWQCDVATGGISLWGWRQ